MPSLTKTLADAAEGPKRLELPLTVRQRPAALRSPHSSPCSSMGEPQKVQVLSGYLSGFTSPVMGGRGGVYQCEEASLSPVHHRGRGPLSPQAGKPSTLRASGLLQGYPPAAAQPAPLAPSELQLPSKMLRSAAGSLPNQVADTDQEALWEAAGGDDLGEPSPSFAQSRSGALVRFPPGLRPPPNTPSHGSVLHVEGTCRPCAWFWKPGSCKNGEDCGHCHLCPEGEIKARKKAKQTVMRLGLATPKPGCLGGEDDPFAVISVPKHPETLAQLISPMACRTSKREAILCVHSDQESTTGPLSEQELLAGSSEQESDGQGTPKGGASADRPVPEDSIVFLPPGLLDFPPGLPTSPSARGSPAHYGSDGGEGKSKKKSKAAMMRLGAASPNNAAAAEQQAKFALSLTDLL